MFCFTLIESSAMSCSPLNDKRGQAAFGFDLGHSPAILMGASFATIFATQLDGTRRNGAVWQRDCEGVSARQH
jgi:hypothetical protein